MPFNHLYFQYGFLGIGGDFLAIFLLAYLILHIRHIVITQQAILLALFSIFYFIFYSYHSSFVFADVPKYLVLPWACYLVGSHFIRNSPNRNLLLLMIISISAGFFLHGTLNVVSYQFFHRVDERYARLAYDFWHKNYLSVTAQGLLFLFLLPFQSACSFSVIESGLFRPYLSCLSHSITLYSRHIALFLCLRIAYSRDSDIYFVHS